MRSWKGEREREREEACCLVAALRDQFRYLPLSTGALSPPWCVWKNQAQLGNSSSLPLLANSSCPSVAQGTCHSVCWVPEGAAPSPLATARPDLIRATWSGWRRQVARLGAGQAVFEKRCVPASIALVARCALASRGGVHEVLEIHPVAQNSPRRGVRSDFSLARARARAPALFD